MAKIGNLQVENIKIAGGALTHFVIGGGTSITVNNDGGNPTFLWLENASGTMTLTRTRDGAVLFQGKGYFRSVALDANPTSAETYTVDQGVIRGANFRWR